MNAFKLLEGINWPIVLSLLVMIVATGVLTFLWVLQRLVKKRADLWVADNPLKSRNFVSRRPFKPYAGKHKRLQRASKGIRDCANRLLKWHEQRLIKSGMSTKAVSQRARQWCLSVLGVSLFLILRDYGHPGRGLLFCTALSLYFWILTGSKIKVRKNTFVTGVYKIYRQMALQISSGMSSSEAIKYLHESVEEPFLKEAMYRFASCYFKTMDLDLALRELTERIEGDEVQVLATVLRQGLQTGDSYEMIIKQEQLMVKRYYAALSAESQRIRTRGILLAIGLCLLIFLLLAAPMVYEMGRATQSIFLGQ